MLSVIREYRLHVAAHEGRNRGSNSRDQETILDLTERIPGVATGVKWTETSGLPPDERREARRSRRLLAGGFRDTRSSLPSGLTGTRADRVECPALVARLAFSSDAIVESSMVYVESFARRNRVVAASVAYSGSRRRSAFEITRPPWLTVLLRGGSRAANERQHPGVVLSCPGYWFNQSVTMRRLAYTPSAVPTTDSENAVVRPIYSPSHQPNQPPAVAPTIKSVLDMVLLPAVRVPWGMFPGTIVGIFREENLDRWCFPWRGEPGTLRILAGWTRPSVDRPAQSENRVVCSPSTGCAPFSNRRAVSPAMPPSGWTSWESPCARRWKTR